MGKHCVLKVKSLASAYDFNSPVQEIAFMKEISKTN